MWWEYQRSRWNIASPITSTRSGRKSSQNESVAASAPYGTAFSPPPPMASDQPRKALEHAVTFAKLFQNSSVPGSHWLICLGRLWTYSAQSTTDSASDTRFDMILYRVDEARRGHVQRGLRVIDADKQAQPFSAQRRSGKRRPGRTSTYRQQLGRGISCSSARFKSSEPVLGGPTVIKGSSSPCGTWRSRTSKRDVLVTRRYVPLRDAHAL